MASRFAELRELEKEEKRRAKEEMRLSKQDTERLLGKNWRERAAAKRATPEYRASKAQKALEERAAVNRSLLSPSAYAPLPEEGKTEVDLPGGGKATFGAETLRNIRASREVPEQQRAEGRRKVVENINRMNAEAYKRNKQRYEQGLAERGLRSPTEGATPQERRGIEERNSAAMMSDFRQALDDKRKAKVAENLLVQEYRDYKRAASEARKNKDYESAIIAEQKASNINEQVGGDIANISSRNRYFSNLANEKTKTELARRAEERRAINQKRTTANPEAASPKRVDLTPKSTGAPIGVGTESLTYDQEPVVGGATQQPFGMVPPTAEDRGVSFGEISPANVSETIAEPPSSSAPQPASATPTAPKAKTSKEVTQEDIQPGISEVRMPPRAEGESVADYNNRSNEEYERQVIIPSFDEGTQSALLSAREINNELNSLFGVRFQSKENVNRYINLLSDVRVKRNVLKDKIKELRSQRRKVAFSGGNQAKFIDQQIATLDNELGTIEKFLF
jgi:hypothetical protein